MKIPNKVKICGLDYEVKFEDGMAMNEGLAGEHCTHTLTIRLQKKDYKQQKIEQTFFHEVIHALDDHYLNNKMNEDQVSAMANGIYAFLKDNNLLK